MKRLLLAFALTACGGSVDPCASGLDCFPPQQAATIDAGVSHDGCAPTQTLTFAGPNWRTDESGECQCGLKVCQYEPGTLWCIDAQC